MELTKNFKTIETWSEARDQLDVVLSQLQDQSRTNPTLHSLVDARESTPTMKLGDLVADYRSGQLEMKISDGDELQGVPVQSFTGGITPEQHGALSYGYVDEQENTIFLHPLATPEAPGFMSAQDKSKLDAIGVDATPSEGGDSTTGVVVGGVGSPGASAEYAKEDHTHGISVANVVAIGTANSAGTANSVARSNHVHAHGNLAGGSFHAEATPTVAGFMAASDKVALGHFKGAFNQPGIPSLASNGDFAFWYDTGANQYWVVFRVNGATRRVGPAIA